MTTEELLARARELLPLLREHAAAAYERGAPVPEVERAFADAGLHRMAVPADDGGPGAGLPAFAAVLAMVARACPTSAASLAGTRAGAQADGFLEAGMCAVALGAAAGAVEAYEALVRTEPTDDPPLRPRLLDADHQRWLGAAIGRLAAAECILTEALEQHSPADPLLWLVCRETAKLCHATVHEIVVRTAGPGAMRQGAPLERIVRSLAALRSDPPGGSEESIARRVGRDRLGIPAES